MFAGLGEFLYSMARLLPPLRVIVREKTAPDKCRETRGAQDKRAVPRSRLRYFIYDQRTHHASRATLVILHTLHAEMFATYSASSKKNTHLWACSARTI